MANEDAAEFEQCFVYVTAALVADAQTAVLVKPTVRAFHDPAMNAQAAAVPGVAMGDLRGDASRPQGHAMLV